MTSKRVVPIRSVWTFPRPPAVEAETRLVTIVLNGATIARSARALQVLETSHPPSIYVPIADVEPGVLEPGRGSSVCEYKGRAVYWNLVVGAVSSANAAWSYPHPKSGYEALRDHVSVYPGRVDICRLGDEEVKAQAGEFYGGWITSDVIGPFKGTEGTESW